MEIYSFFSGANVTLKDRYERYPAYYYINAYTTESTTIFHPDIFEGLELNNDDGRELLEVGFVHSPLSPSPSPLHPLHPSLSHP